MNLEDLRLVNGIYRAERYSPVTFLWADNMEFLRWCKEEMLMGYWHVGIIDPPYGIGVGDMRLGTTIAKQEKNPRQYEMGKWDNETPTQEYFDLIKYVCRNIILFGGNYFTNKLTNINPGRSFSLWDKGNDKMSFAFGELALTTFDKNPLRISKPRNLQQQDGEKRHPTQKPVYVYDALYGYYVEKKWKVLDTHGGSFSHAVAAWKHGIDLTIMDKDENYFKDGLDAYKIATTQNRLIF